MEGLARATARVLSRDLRVATTREARAVLRYCDDLPQLAKIEAALRSGKAERPMSSGQVDPQVVRRQMVALRPRDERDR